MNRIEIGKALTYVRVSQNKTIYATAKLAKISQAMANSIEQGSANYTIDSLLAYASVLKVEIEINKEPA